MTDQGPQHEAAPALPERTAEPGTPARAAGFNAMARSVGNASASQLFRQTVEAAASAPAAPPTQKASPFWYGGGPTIARSGDAPAAAPTATEGEGADAEKKGPPLKIKFGSKEHSWDAVKAVSASAEADEEIKKEWGDAKQWPLAPLVVGNFGLKGEVGLTAKGLVSGGFSRTKMMAPTTGNEDRYWDEFTVGGTLSLEAFAKGSVKIGLGIGWPVANVTGNLVGELSAIGTTSIAIEGKASRTATPARDEFSDWSGSIDMPITMGIGIEAVAGGSIDFDVTFADGSFAEWEFAKWTIAEGKIVCKASVGIPGGLVTDSVEITELKFNPPPDLFPRSRSMEELPWEQQGVSGSGPGTEVTWVGEPPPEDGSEGGGDGSGGAPPEPATPPAGDEGQGGAPGSR